MHAWKSFYLSQATIPPPPQYVFFLNPSLRDAWSKHLTQHNLPPLSTVRTVRNLAAAHRDAYFAGYYPGAPLPPPAGRIPRILAALGVMT
jgi:hypothetical protein